MKTFNSATAALIELEKVKQTFVLKTCPFSQQRSNTCGSWCPHFFINEADKEIYITCSGAEVLLGNLDE